MFLLSKIGSKIANVHVAMAMRFFISEVEPPSAVIFAPSYLKDCTTSILFFSPPG